MFCFALLLKAESTENEIENGIFQKRKLENREHRLTIST